MLPETSIQLLDIPKKIYVEFDSQKGKLFTTEVKEYIYSSNGSGIPVTLLITDKQFAPYRQNVFPGFSCKVIVEVDNMYPTNSSFRPVPYKKHTIRNMYGSSTRQAIQLIVNKSG